VNDRFKEKDEQDQSLFTRKVRAQRCQLIEKMIFAGPHLPTAPVRRCKQEKEALPEHVEINGINDAKLIWRKPEKRSETLKTETTRQF
jgi:hypothetical protein